jgi:hypothetical protein
MIWMLTPMSFGIGASFFGVNPPGTRPMLLSVRLRVTDGPILPNERMGGSRKYQDGEYQRGSHPMLDTGGQGLFRID